MPNDSTRDGAAGAYGANAWLVEEMFEAFRTDPSSVSESWRDFFADYRSPSHPAAEPAASSESRAERPSPPPSAAATPPVGRFAAEAAGATAAPPEAAEDTVVTLRGAAARVAENMVASLSVPTATSVHPVPAKLLEVNRQIINNQLRRTIGGKVSFTHIIGWAVVRALRSVPALNSSFVADLDGSGTPGVVRHRHVGLGLAVDVERGDGSRSLVVPCVKRADELDFASFVHAYEELVRKVRTNKLAVEDLAGVTVTLTNPGTVGTTQSVPRLMPGQGAIIGIGSLAYPPEFAAADPATLAELGVSKVVALTSTYDHRVIQGAESGLFLTRVHELLVGEHGFYDEIFDSLRVPYQPARWHQDVNPFAGGDGEHGRLAKQAAVQALINMYRVRGHLMAHLDPLRQRAANLHSELDPLTYGLTVFDLERRFVGLSGETEMPLGRILGLLRDAYCRTVGIQYMHIQDPEQKYWIQRHVEGVAATLTPEEQWHVLERLNAAEAFERFLHTRYVGQKRFGLEGAEAAIPLLDAVLEEAAESGLEQAVLGMAHRGRLNVLANIVGKSYGELFAEFEGNLDPETVQGSGDVKYHKGATGKFVGRSGRELTVVLASNPSHLEAVDPVVEGMARARQDRHVNLGTFPVLPVLVHGDAAFAGQGVVAETLELSQLHGYRTGGTVHLVINNQLGFTTPTEAARSSVYCTDVALTVQAPIFHVNGDDPEACVRVARLAVAFRQAFHKDVVIDLVCYRRYGHNEGDDPSYTQPLMYREIEERRSARKLYTEALVRRGDFSLEEAEAALADFSKRLQQALDETRAAAPPHPDRLHRPQPAEVPGLSTVPTGVDRPRLDQLAERLHTWPAPFSVHPKLALQLERRAETYAAGEVDWSLAEALSLGSLLAEGIDVRMAGQDTRRGTFSQRHGVLVDYETGAEYVPLSSLSTLPGLPPEGAGSFMIYDSLLSEYAALAFEYGYSVETARALVAWEAQFGDFANGAQIVIDNFIAAAGEKWGQQSALVLLLPHGYEGQGPEHSSARLERFLQLCAGGNMTVAEPTTAAQYFHLLRAQALRRLRRPLVVLTPKSLLRARQARSPIEELGTGRFEAVIDDPATVPGAGFDPAEVERLVLCSGKVAFDAMGRRDETGAKVAVVRLEQLYPWPEAELAAVVARYPGLSELVWLQEQPENMGAWSYLLARLPGLAPSVTPGLVSRPAAGSPATGSATVHQLELRELLDRALGAGAVP